MIAATRIFKVKATAYMSCLFRLWLGKYWYVPVGIIVPFLALIFYNILFVYVALMVLFFVIPLLFAFVYFYNAFSPKCVDAIRSSRIEFGDVGFKRYYVNEIEEITGDRYYEWRLFGRVEVDDREIKIFYTSNPLYFILVPNDVFEDVNSRTALIEKFRELALINDVL